MFGLAIWIHQFCSGRIVMFVSFFRSGSDLVGHVLDALQLAGPQAGDARAWPSVTIRNVTVSKQACL